MWIISSWTKESTTANRRQMDRNQLIEALDSVINRGSQLSTVVYAVQKNKEPIKVLNIVNTEINTIQEMFIESIKSSIISVEEQTLLKVSEADERTNCIFEYDLEVLPESLSFINAQLHDELPRFNFDRDNLADIETLIIEIGTEEQQLALIKHVSPVEIIGRGNFILWKARERLEKFEENILRFTPKFHALKINETIIFIDLKTLESKHGFHSVIIKEAESRIKQIDELNLLENIQPLTDLMNKVSLARKIVKIKNSPVLLKNIPNEKIIDFTKTHPYLKGKMDYSADDKQIILKTKKAAELFLKMLDDVFLNSNLTLELYESKAKDKVSLD